jgi:F0F1-type ATP synthase assembly protein I
VYGLAPRQRGSMPAKNRGSFLTRSVRAFQDSAQRSGPAATASYTLVGAILLLGGAGYAIDAWRGTAPWFLFGGLLFGMLVGFYQLAKTVWQRP